MEGHSKLPGHHPKETLEHGGPTMIEAKAPGQIRPNWVGCGCIRLASIPSEVEQSHDKHAKPKKPIKDGAYTK